MKVKHKDIEFRISRRTLWIGVRAFPLHMIASVEPVEIKLRRGRIVSGYLRQAGSWIGLGFVGLLILGCLGDAVPTAVTGAFVVVVLGALTFHTVLLIRNLNLPSLHILSVTTAGRAHAALVSTDKNLIDGLARRVVYAIDNPAMEYAIRVEHLEIAQGDIVHGNRYGGHHIEGDQINNWA